jgi:hypothetical protein
LRVPDNRNGLFCDNAKSAGFKRQHAS